MAVSTGRSWPLHCEVRKETAKGNGKTADIQIAELVLIQVSLPVLAPSGPVLSLAGPAGSRYSAQQMEGLKSRLWGRWYLLSREAEHGGGGGGVGVQSSSPNHVLLPVDGVNSSKSHLLETGHSDHSDKALNQIQSRMGILGSAHVPNKCELKQI